MEIRSQDAFLSIHTEGGLLPTDLLQRVLANDKTLPGLEAESYYLLPGETLREQITNAWKRLNLAWEQFQTARGKLPESELGTSQTRERWLLPLFEALGYGRLRTAPAIELGGKYYPISHPVSNLPIHLLGCKVDLDRRTSGVAGASQTSPHSLVQEFLNRNPDQLWGFVSNGLRLRLLRDNASLTRQAYLEFDLESMFTGQAYSDFSLLWLTCHASRFAAENPAEGWLEQWSKAAQDQGVRALEQLRSGVQEAIQALGSGFLAHPANGRLRERLQSGALDRQEYYRQLLRLVYRLIFLFAAEDRDLLHAPQAEPEARQAYWKYYSTARLRRLARRQRGDRHSDLWQALRLVMDFLGRPRGCPQLGLYGLGSFLFSNRNTDPQGRGAIPDLEEAQIENGALLEAVRNLAFTVENRTLRAVDYRNLGPEELGSVYESLLELHPAIHIEAAAFELQVVAGSERKTTGSYYTPTSLIQVLLDSALDPVIEEALSRSRRMAQGELRLVDGEWELASGAWKDEREREWFYSVVSGFGGLADPQPGEKGRIASGEWEKVASHWNQAPFAARHSLLASHALLALNVCDPACGSGHFLIAAAHRIARQLALACAGGDEPAPLAYRQALRQVIARCIYGVDLNPLAIELCKVNLWLEALEPGKPLSFLDAHIKCGNSLVGVGPGIDISKIPDAAFNPVTGDDRATASALKRRNKREKEAGYWKDGQKAGQLGFRWEGGERKSATELAAALARQAIATEALPEETPAQVQAKAQAYQELIQDRQYYQKKVEYDLWAAAFFWPIPKSDAEHLPAPTHQELILLQNTGEIDARLAMQVEELAKHQQFFHWQLAFPQIFSGGVPGFDCVLGNPPWERIKLQEEEFFASRDPEIAAAPNKAQRQRLIDRLPQNNPLLAQEFARAKHAAECSSKFVRHSQRFPLTAVGDVNTYALFAEQADSLMSQHGRVGMIVPTGIATDDTTKDFFGALVERRRLAGLYDFENREAIFPGVHRSYKFCLLTLSGQSIASAQFVFFATRVEHLRDEQRRFSLTPEDIALFNPNTRTMPVFRTRQDAELARKIYQRTPVLVNERTGENPWGVSFLRMFDMSNDSGLFVTEPRPGYVRLYEGKMVQAYDHRAASSVTKIENLKRPGQSIETRLSQYQNPQFSVTPQYYVELAETMFRLSGKTKKSFILAYKSVTSPTNERTMITALLPICGVAHSMNLVFLSEADTALWACFLANFNTLILDFFAKLKVGGVNLSYFFVRQFPALIPNSYNTQDVQFISKNVLELSYTAYDLKSFAEDLGYHGEPFPWDEERRARLRAELDAYYAHLYGLTRDELRYILDPQDVYGPDFPGETFRVLKDKEIRQYGEYRTRRLVLEAWDRLFPDAPVESEIIRRPRPQLKKPPSYASEYTLEPRPLGEGGQAEVFPATQRKTGQRVALKRLSKSQSKMVNAVARLEYEIQVQALVQHPHVMPVIDYGEDFTWYTMPLADDLLSRRTPPLDPQELLEILAAVGRGLAAAHAKKYIHRDIKPSNILHIDFPPEGPRWVISDWGLVRRQELTTEVRTQAEGGFGTLGFAPPEFWEDPHAANPSADVYSLGRVIAWGLTGRAPAPNIPLLPAEPGWRELVEEMTRLEAGERLQSMREVLERLEELRQG